MTTITKEQVADYLKEVINFGRFARLSKALGNQLNTEQLRFFKSFVFEKSLEPYSNNSLKYVGQDGCDFLIPSLDNTKLEMKYTENALFTPRRKELRESTGGIKLMNSMGTNTHKTLPQNYSDFLIYVGQQGAMLFDKPTLEIYLKITGDGIFANIPVDKGILLAGPDTMNSDNQQEVDFIDGLLKYVDSYIANIE